MINTKISSLIVYPCPNYLVIVCKEIPRRLTWFGCKICLNFLLILISMNNVWHHNLSFQEQCFGSRLLFWVSCEGIYTHCVAICNHIAGCFFWKKYLAWKSKRVKFLNAFQSYKIRANSFREWQARYCQNASQRGRIR